MISAEIVCDSTAGGKRITTMKLRYPKFIHGEFMTHRVFSRNASSSRAIPSSKLIEEVRSDELRAAPVFWGKNQPGMQAAEELSDQAPMGRDHWEQQRSDRQMAQRAWREAANAAAHYAVQLVAIGAHKQIVNRVLEPFSHINVVVTATEWANFFGLRLSKDAQPEMRTLAEAMWMIYNESRPQPTGPSAWHLPYCTLEGDRGSVRDVDQPAVRRYAEANGLAVVEVAKRVSVARCARVSYESFETGRRSTVEEDLVLHDRLRASGHWSPFEHQATPDVRKDVPGTKYWMEWENWFQHGNFVGWRQYRKMIPGEDAAPLPEEYR